MKLSTNYSKLLKFRLVKGIAKALLEGVRTCHVTQWSIDLRYSRIDMYVCTVTDRDVTESKHLGKSHLGSKRILMQAQN